jgi:hypothetical protein
VKPLAGDLKPDGSRVTARDLRLKAEQVCQAIERSIQLERQGEVTEANLRRILSETLERVEGRRLTHPSVAEWLEQWIETREAQSASEPCSNTSRSKMLSCDRWAGAVTQSSGP